MCAKRSRMTRVFVGIGLVLLCIALVVLLTGGFGPRTVVNAHLQGWYPTETEALKSSMMSLDKQAQERFSAVVEPGSIRALIVPHAGYAYSGDVATAVYRLVRSVSIRRVIVLAPSHYGMFVGAALPLFATYKTPLGLVSMDRAVIQQLEKSSLLSEKAQLPLLREDEHVYKTEHSFEIQLPFIQTYIKNALVVPLLISSISQSEISDIATMLAPFIDAHTLVIVSSDFTHYGKKFDYTPFAQDSQGGAASSDTIQCRIRQLDSGALQAIQQYDMPGFLSYVKETGDTICGKNALAILLELLEKGAFGDVEPRLIAYKTSTQVTGQADESVSYVGIAFVTNSMAPRGDQSYEDLFTEYEKKALLAMSRTVLEQLFEKRIRSELLYPIITKENSTPRGAFVTLYKKKELRGCIGRTTSQEPLYKTVMAMTRSAAFEDSRFSPVTVDELPDITISISVLTKPRPIKSYKDIIIGKHGIILTRGGNTALFLPKVATEFGWDLPTTLSHLSKKAGLTPDAWQESDVTYQVFESIDFCE